MGTAAERMIKAKFLRRTRTWTTTVATPLDGDLRLRVTTPGGGADGVTLLSGDGHRARERHLEHIRGQVDRVPRLRGRSVKVRVTRGGAAARFTLRVQAP